MPPKVDQAYMFVWIRGMKVRVASGLEAIPAVTPCTGCQSVVGQENYITSSISVGTATVEEYFVYLFINKRSSKG